MIELDGILVVRVLAGLEVSELSVDSMLLALPGIGLSLPIEESHVVALDRRAGNRDATDDSPRLDDSRVLTGAALDLKLSLLKEDDPITSPETWNGVWIKLLRIFGFTS